MLINYRNLIVATVIVLMLTACGEDNAPSSAANKTPQEPSGEAMMAPAGTPPATTTTQENTETAMESAASPAMSGHEPAGATTSATAETQASSQPEELTNDVVYQDEIYKNWPRSSETPQPPMSESGVAPQPEELTNNVVYQDEIYKNWPTTVAPQPEAAPAINEVVENKVATAVSSVEKKAETVATAVEEKAGTTVAAAAGQSAQPAAGGTTGQTIVVNAEARAFNPDIIYIQPGDTVQWTNMTSHTSTSIDGLIPDGATPWNGALGENLQVTLTVPGIYGYYCIPHIGFGMMGVIVVGKPTNLDEVKAYADKNMQGPFRRILGKLKKVSIP